MADWGGIEEETTAGQPAACQVCEAMLPDAVDGVLSETEQRAFNRHVAGCVVCARELEEAQRGAAWLGMLKQQAPEPAPMLLERILAQMSGIQTSGIQTAQRAVTAAAEARASAGRAAALQPASVLPVWANTAPVGVGRASRWKTLTGALSFGWMRPMLQPRMAMTAAMAFFSIALTLNLTGVRLQDLNASSLQSASLRRTVAERGAAAVRGFQNMRVVYQAEAQAHDLRETWQQGRDPQPEQPERRAPENGTGDKPGPSPDRNADKPEGSSQLDFSPVVPQGNGTTRKGA